MRTVIKALIVLTALAALPSTSASATTAKPATKLVFSVDAGEGLWTRWTLNCSPTSGTHPQRARACTVLARQGMAVFAGVPADAMCTEIYGGPQRVRITGTVKGHKVATRFNRINGCEIARWDRAGALLGFPGLLSA